MAVIEDPVFGKLSGKLDHLVFYHRNGKTHVRQRPFKFKDAKTPAQQKVRNRLTAAVRFYQNLTETPLQRVWISYGRQMSKNAYHCFISVNSAAFTPDGESADFSRLRLSGGPLSAATFLPVEKREEGVYRISWEKQAYSANCRADDALQVALVGSGEAFKPVLLEEVTAFRSKRFCDIALPGEGATHLYLFFASRYEDLFSESVHFVLS